MVTAVLTDGIGWIKGGPHFVGQFVLIAEQLACHRHVSTRVGGQQEHTDW